jgi:hypothetical protein
MRKVYAIDPAELGVQRNNIVHLRARAEVAVYDIKEEIDLLVRRYLLAEYCVVVIDDPNGPAEL